MKKVLIISYYFPPSGGPGVHRVLKFVKYLPYAGWHPVVLTVKDADYPARDESLLSEIPDTVTVYRTRILEPYRLYRKLTGKSADAPVDVENIPQGMRKKPLSESFASFVRSTFFIPDARIGWYPYAVAAGRKIVRQEGIEAIYSSSPPYTSAVVARQIHRKTGVPWIAGLRDPWTGFLSTPDRWFLPQAVDRHMEHSVLKEATAVEVAWRGILKDILQKYPSLGRDKFHYIPNGFDPEDYPIGQMPSNERFTVAYAGSMYGRRNPRTFLQSIEALARDGKVDPSRIALRFIGRFGSEVKRMLDESALQKHIEIVPYLPHQQSILELVKADALLLVVDEAGASEEIVPGKVFEYLGARKPIIALAPEGAAAQLVRETRSGSVAHNNDVPAIKRAFLECYENFVYRTPQFQQDEKAVAKYERRETTRSLAALLDSVINQPSGR